MNSVGQILKKSRIEQNIKINEVASELKISQETLIKFETDKINTNSDIVFSIGHLKSYSKYLGLDHELIIKKFREQEALNLIETPEVIARPSFESKYIKVSKLMPLSLIIIIFTSFYFLFINDDKNQSDYALVPDLPDIYEPIIEKESLKMSKNTIQTEINVNYISKDQISSSSAFASNKNLNNKNKTITLKFLNPTWFQVRDKSENIIISKLMEKNEEYTYKIENEYTVTAGNAGNIMVLIDNNVRGKIGKQGEVVDSLYIDYKFNN